MSDDAKITILHLSDLQFGRNHRFGRFGLTDPDIRADTLFARLKRDLEDLSKDHSLWPDLVVVTGDLAEWARPKEFDDVYNLLDDLAVFLKLPHSRFSIVPGNHDINRGICQCYFIDCEQEDGRKPERPYWPKWKYYGAFFERFYRGEPDVAFPPDAPWTLFRVPDLRVAVAGLNSTMAESHQDDDHYGWLGEDQLNDFQAQLESFAEAGWLRIGAVHHNVQRGAQADDENLRDADALEDKLGDSVNLILHGHTHQGKLG